MIIDREIKTMFGAVEGHLKDLVHVANGVYRKLASLEAIAKDINEFEKKLLVWMERYVNLNKRVSDLEAKSEDSIDPCDEEGGEG